MSTDAGDTPDSKDDTSTTDSQDSGDDEPTGEVDWAKEAAKWKALSRKHEADAKKNAASARKLAETEEADKSEVQRATDRATQAEERAKAAESRAARMEVAAAKGLSLAMASRLVGETKEELEADADELMTELRPATGAGPKPGDTPGGRPRETLRSGTAPDTKPEETDPAKLAAMVPRF